MRPEKASVRRFYDSFGWRKNSSGTYNDTASFVDLRTVLSSYYHRTQVRLNRYLRPRGEYFLDAGCGPVSQPEYLTYSAGYRHRVCVDLSLHGLVQARYKLGTHALCVVADLVSLPFRRDVFDAVLASHVLYHIPADEQLAAIHEFYRTLRYGARCVIIYIWPTSIATELIRKTPCSQPTQLAPTLYFVPQDYEWFVANLPKQWRVDFRPWRSVDMAFTQKVIADNAVGALILNLIYLLEEMLPHWLARVGRYPLIILEKKQAPAFDSTRPRSGSPCRRTEIVRSAAQGVGVERAAPGGF